MNNITLWIADTVNQSLIVICHCL